MNVNSGGGGGGGGKGVVVVVVVLVSADVVLVSRKWRSAGSAALPPTLAFINSRMNGRGRSAGRRPHYSRGVLRRASTPSLMRQPSPRLSGKCAPIKTIKSLQPKHGVNYDYRSLMGYAGVARRRQPMKEAPLPGVGLGEVKVLHALKEFKVCGDW